MSFQPLRVAVEARDAEHDPGGVLGPVVVGGHRVVHERELDLAVERRLARRHAVAAPLAARDDRRRRPGLRRGGRRPPAEARDQRAPVGRSARTKRARRARGAPRRRSWNSSAAPTNAGSVPAGTRAAVRRVVAGRVQRDPLGPAAAAAAGAHLRLGARAARPAQPDQVEAARRAQRPGSCASRRRAAAVARPSRTPSRSSSKSERAARRAPGRRGAGSGRGGERTGLEDLPTGERTSHDQLEHGDRWKGPHRSAPGSRSCRTPCDATGRRSPGRRRAARCRARRPRTRAARRRRRSAARARRSSNASIFPQRSQIAWW